MLRKKIYQIELDDDNFNLMNKCMNAYIKQRNNARERQRFDSTKPQKRASLPIEFHYDILKEFDIFETRVRSKPLDINLDMEKN